MEIEQQHLRHTSDKGLLLEVHLYVTSAKTAADLKALNVYLSLDLIGKENAANINAIDRIRQRTKHGRPNWDQVKKIIKQLGGEEWQISSIFDLLRENEVFKNSC